MKATFGKVLGVHRALWDFDTWYRYAWLAAPQAVSIAALFLVFSDAGPPPAAPWVKPLPGTAQPNPDHPLCMNANPDAKLRGEACDRLIKSGRLTGVDLAGAYLGRGVMKQGAKQVDEAIADYSEAIRLNPKEAGALAARGSQYLSKNDLASAEKDLESAIEISSGYTRAYAFALKAELRRRQGKLPEAQTHVDKALELQKDMEYAKLVRDSILADIKSAEERTKRPQTSPEAKPPPRRDDPSEAMRTRAYASLQKGDHDLAIAEYTELILGGSRVSGDYANRGTAYASKQQLDLAMADFNQAIGLSGHTWYPHLKRGEIHVRRGDLARAMTDFDAAIRDHAGNDSRIFYQRGRIFLQQQAWGPALDDFDKLVQLAPDYAEGYLLRAQASAGNTRAVLENCRRQNAQPDRNTLVGGPCSRPMNFSMALDDLKTAISRKPELAEAHYETGRILYDLNRHGEAVDAYSQALRVSPNYSYAYNNRGVTYLKLNRRDRALADFTDAIRADPRNKIALTNRGEMRESARQRREAIEDFRAALAVDPQHTPALDGLRRLGVRQ
jgi:tetratricopeptide (TPR) repeat protein